MPVPAAHVAGRVKERVDVWGFGRQRRKREMLLQKSRGRKIHRRVRDKRGKGKAAVSVLERGRETGR